jgi:hypothetical protein
MIERRQFLRQTSMAACGLLLFDGRKSAMAAASSAPCRIEVLLGEEVGTISPNIYGHFAENLSGVVYDGIWVGKNSKVPNIDGIRSELVEQMRKIKPSVIRFPGGVFRRQLRLARRCRAERQASAANQFLGWRGGSQRTREPSLRPQPVRNRRVCALLQADRRVPLPGGQCSESAGRGILSLGRVLQLSRGKHHSCGPPGSGKSGYSRLQLVPAARCCRAANQGVESYRWDVGDDISTCFGDNVADRG